MKIGYARVSTDDQNMSLQLDALTTAGCEKIFQDEISGITTKRPGLDAALATLQPGDVLTVWRLDRLGRSTPHLVSTVNDLAHRDPACHRLGSLDQSRRARLPRCFRR